MTKKKENYGTGQNKSDAFVVEPFDLSVCDSKILSTFAVSFIRRYHEKQNLLRFSGACLIFQRV